MEAVLARGEGSIVHTEDGRELVDLATGFGAVFLGHSHPGVTASLQRQASRILATARLPTAIGKRVAERIAALLPRGLAPAGLYSTGMEVAEFAARIASAHTGRGEFAGFARSMHGKSVMTAALAWPNSPARPGNAHVLPFVDTSGEAEALAALDKLLRTGRIAALFLEPIQGSNAAHEASTDFYRRAFDACAGNGTLVVMDETLTALHRTGPRFYSDLLDRTPDVLLFAKCLGNGFPVSSAAVRDGIRVGPAALPGSTFSGNPMAQAAVEATLAAMAELPMEARVAQIEATVRKAFSNLPAGATLRGRGALWCVELDPARLPKARAAIEGAGLLVTSGARFVRLLPAVTMDTALLRESCEKVARACAQALA